VVAVPLLAGRRNVLCASDDIITHYENGPTKSCVILGALLHFSLLCAATFFLGSVFNVTVAVLTFARDTIVRRHARAVFVIECVAAVVVPGSLVGYTAGTAGYLDDMFLGDFSTFWCYIGSKKTFFFTMVVPLQIVCLSTTTMVILIIRRLRQSILLRNSLLTTKDSGSIAQIVLMKRFVVIAILIPLASVTAFTMSFIFDIPSLSKQLQVDTTRYAVCSPDSGVNTQNCNFKFTTLMGGYAFCQALDLIGFALLSILLLVYSLIPAPARQFWASYFKQVRRLFCRGTDEEETVLQE
jgi:hypothetical protein